MAGTNKNVSEINATILNCINAQYLPINRLTLSQMKAMHQITKRSFLIHWIFRDYNVS